MKKRTTKHTATLKEIRNLVSPINIKSVLKGMPEKKKRSHKVVLSVEKVWKTFELEKRKATVLKNVSMRVYTGEFVILYGPSGCGKSTFLHTILGLEEPTRGVVKLRGKDLYKMPMDEQRSFRREKVGMVFQQSNWIKALNVWENVAYPLWLSGMDESSSKKKSLEVLEEVGMAQMAENRPSELSGGQQQRVSLARALSGDPWMIVADEPTGNLDTRSSEEIISLIVRLNREERRTIIMVTHELGFLPIANRRVGMQDGRIVYDEHD